MKKLRGWNRLRKIVNMPGLRAGPTRKDAAAESQI